jgi:putative nucleotidyltransferase with HDIG domain
LRLISIQMCRPGMRLGKNIYNEKGLVLLGQNIELTQALIDRLDRTGISQLYVQDPRTEDIEIKELLTDETRVRAITEIRSSFRGLMDDNHNRRKTPSNQYLGRDFRKLMDLVLDDLSNHENAMIMLNTINITDHYLYQHSLNVCLYAAMLGMANGYTKDELMVLGLGALLHDIGKTQIPADILKKPGKLSEPEFDVIKTHTELGFKILKDAPNIPLISAHCAFQHHERLDGSGYPRQIEDKEIHEYAKWIGLVDVYDAMTTHRVYRKAMLPHQAIEILYAGAGTQFDQKKLECFRDRIALYPLGITVKLLTGETGVVVDINSSIPQRPVVRIITDADGQDLTQPYEIDLSKKLNVMIASVNDVIVK